MSRAQDAMRARFGAAVNGTQVLKRRKPTRIENLTIDEVSLVHVGANPHARVVLWKAGTEPARRSPAVATPDMGPGLPPDWSATLARVASGEIGRRKPATAATAPPSAPEAQSGAPAGRAALLAALEAHGREVAGVPDLDGLSAQDVALRSPGGLAILRAIQAADG